MDNYSYLLSEFKNTSEELNKLIQKFPSKKREEISFDKWSLKNVVSHLNHWMIHNLNCLDSLAQGKVPYWQPDTDEYNLQGVEKRKNWTWEEVYSEFLDLKAKQILSYENLPKELREKKFWEDRRHTPFSFLEKDITHWRDEHIVSLNNFFENR